MKLFAFLGVILASTQAMSHLEHLNQQWNTFKTNHNKVYESTTEELYRFETFMGNLEVMEKHNARYEMGLETYEMGTNQFSDLQFEEFFNTIKCHMQREANEEEDNGIEFSPPFNYTAPGSVDWRRSGYVTGVKNQGQCGSCWSFAATGALEGQLKKKRNSLVSLSEQNLVDCSGRFGNRGCNGGRADWSYNYVRWQKGIDSEERYPYRAVQGGCRYCVKCSAGTVTGYTRIPSGSEPDLLSAVASEGPVAVAINVTPGLQHYRGGVFFDPACRTNPLNHAVLVVGYGRQGNHDYWLVKNSWGAYWGEGGYIRMVRNRNNHCGIANDALYPLV